MRDDKIREKKKAEGMNRLSKGIFAPVYPVIAEKIVAECGITTGVCIDLGCGPGSLGIALAKKTDLDILLIDNSEYAKQFAAENIRSENISRRCQFISGDAENLPFRDSSIDLIISRGSVFFWQDKIRSFQEIYRVIAPGCMTFIGGGFGNAELCNRITSEMALENPEWGAGSKSGKNMTVERRAEIFCAIEEAEIPYRILSDESGFWVILKKPL
ncbi:class I SAM-dependent methyltransferase [Methanochimaera problematica]|nr:class I SAM-dependent methyltransferase [Methanoplanus sp. FWC-SCC4]